MKFAAFVSILTFIAISWVLGVRLLLLARATRQLPELCMGASVLLIGGLAYPFALATNVPSLQGTLWGALAFVACTWCVHAGVMATFLFVSRVFRAGDAWARRAAWAAGALLSVTLLAQTRVALLRLPPEETMAANLIPATGLLGMAVLAYAWSAFESLRYWGLMRRRQALGLADGVETHRFLLWGISGAAMVIGAGVNLLASIVTPLSVMHPYALLVTSVCGFTSSTALVLTFLPPARYLSWLREQTA